MIVKTVQELIEQKKLIVNDGYRAKNNELSSMGIPFARAGNINGGFQFHDADRFPIENLGKVGNKISKPGDIVFTSKGTVGRFAFVTERTHEFVYSPQLCFWRSLDHNFLSPEFLYYWMNSREFINQINAVKGQTDMADYVSLTEQKHMKVRIPDIKIQRLIGHHLSLLDKKIELNNRINETLESLAKAIFKEWFIDFGPVKAKAEGKKPSSMDNETTALFPDSFEESELGMIPKGWSCGTLANLCSRVETGGTPKRDEKRYWAPKDIPWLTSGEVRNSVVVKTEQYISQSGFENSSAKKWPPFTTVVAMYGATAGQSTILVNEMTANQACCGLVPENHAVSYVYLVARNSAQIWESRARGSAQQNLNKSLVADLEVVIPPISLLESFNRIVLQHIEMQVMNIKETEFLIELRNLLLPKLISGELHLKEDAVD